MNDAALRATLLRLPPVARSDLRRRLLIADQGDRDRAAEQLLRRRTAEADDLADSLDMLTIADEARRQVARLLGEIEASA